MRTAPHRMRAHTAGSGPGVAGEIDDLLDLTGDIYRFMRAIRTCHGAAMFNEIARLLTRAGMSSGESMRSSPRGRVSVGDPPRGGLRRPLLCREHRLHLVDPGCQYAVDGHSLLFYVRLWDLIGRHVAGVHRESVSREAASMLHVDLHGASGG